MQYTRHVRVIGTITMCCGGARRVEIKIHKKINKRDTSAGCVGVYEIKEYVTMLF